MRDKGGARKEQTQEETRCRSETKCVCICVCVSIRNKERRWEKEGGAACEGESEILTDFAVGIGGVLCRDWGQSPPPQQVYSLLLQTEPTRAHSIELWEGIYKPSTPPQTQTLERCLHCLPWAPSHHTQSNFQKKSVYFYIWEGVKGVVCTKHRNE